MYYNSDPLHNSMPEFRLWLESTARELYDSAVAAFPNTTRRQHATDPIRIVSLEWTPFLGLKTLFIKGLAQNPDGTRGFSEYQPMILWKNVNYNPNRRVVEIIASDRQPYRFERLEYNGHDVLVRCDCGDFHWRFNYYDYLDKSLYGRKRSKYESQGGPPANPQEMPGMCKHIMKLFKALGDAGVVE